MGKQFLFLLLILFIGSVSAQYITGDIYIEESGKVIFSVNTDIELNLEGLSFDGKRLRGETKVLTSMDQGIWSFNLDLGYYETIILDIHLPESVEKVGSIVGAKHILDFNKKTIILIDGNKELSFSVDYEIEPNYYPNFLFFIVIFILLVTVFVLFFKFRKNKKKRLEGIFPLINDKEKEILELLMKKPMRQKEIRKKLNIPKASYSRYLVNLEKKKLILREGEGKNKIVLLK